MVQKIVRTSSGAASDYQKHPLYSKLRLLAVMCTRDQWKQAQFKKKHDLNGAWR